MVEGKFRHLPVVEGDGPVVAMLLMRDIPPEYRIMHQRWMDQTQARTPRREAPVMTSPLPQWARADGLTLNPASALGLPRSAALGTSGRRRRTDGS